MKNENRTSDKEAPQDKVCPSTDKKVSMKDAIKPEELHSEDNPIESRLADINANLIEQFVKIKLQIVGEVSFKAIPRIVHIHCKECGASLTLDLSKQLSLVKDLTISGKYQGDIYNKLLTGKCKRKSGSDEFEEHNVRYTIEDYMDYSLLLVRDLMSFDKKFEVQNYQPKWIHVIDQSVPKTKKISMVGSVVYDERPKKMNIEVIGTKLEPLEDTLENFKVSEEDKRNFQEYFQNEIPIKQLAPSMVGRNDAKEAMLLTTHSPPYIPNLHERLPEQRGLLRIIFIGDTKTNKSTAAKDVTSSHIGGHYPLGEFVSAETGSRTGILYTIDNDKKSLTWGSIVLNDMGLLVLDGLHSLREEEMKSMREVLEQLMVSVRRSVSGDALARTRIIGIINPHKPMKDYSHKCMAIRDTDVFRDQVDITRWDEIIPFTKEDVPNDAIIDTDPDQRPIPDQIFNRHIKWVWSRTSNQIKYPNNIKRLIKTSFHELSDNETAEIPLIHSGFKYTLLRFSVAYACLQHSTDDSHENVIVKECHVKNATNHLKENFKRLGLGEYVKEIEGECFSEDFLEIFSSMDDLGIQILLGLNKNIIGIRSLAKEFGVNKSTIESRVSILRDYNLVDTTGHTKLTPFGMKILKSILKFNQEYEEEVSVDPKKPDTNNKLSLNTQTKDTVQPDEQQDLRIYEIGNDLNKILDELE